MGVFEEIAILAPGLLGASLGKAAKDRGLARRVAVWARRAEVRVACEAEPWCDSVHSDPGDAVEAAELVVVCTPVEHVYPLVQRVKERLRTGALVTDVGSTKSLICRYCHSEMPEGTTFVGSHPMAGSEKTGLAASRVDLFEGKVCLVTPLVDTPDSATERIVRFWRGVGMDPATMSPETHDEIVAHISHLPHLLATLMCTLLARRDPNWRNFAGNGLRDTTRIAAGSPPMWKSIVGQNREEILRAIGGFEEELQALKSAIANDQTFEVLNLLERGKVYRDGLRPEA